MLFLAVDPGITGALALCTTKGEIVACLPMPTFTVLSNKKKKQRVDGEALARTVASYSLAFAVVEMVSAMPGQGVTSMFSFGRGYGVVEGVLNASDIPIQYVSPVVWKKHHGLLKQEKKAAYKCLKKLIGGGQVHSGAADAALIALWKVNKLKQ